MINGTLVLEAELEVVQYQRDALATADRMAQIESAQGQGDHEKYPADEGDVPDNTAGQGTETSMTDLTAADDAAQAADDAATIDLGTLTLDACV